MPSPISVGRVRSIYQFIRDHRGQYGVRIQFVLEDKDLVKRRLGRSPDKADPLAQTFAMDDMPRSVPGPGRRAAGRAITMDDLPYGGQSIWGNR